MEQNKNRPLFISNFNEKHSYVSSGGGERSVPDRNRYDHSQQLIDIYREILVEYDSIQSSVLDKNEGIYLEVLGAKNYDLIVQSLEDSRKGVRLLNIKEGEDVTYATIFLPNDNRDFLLNKILDYQTKPASKTNDSPKNLKLVNSIESIKLATINAFWNEDIPTITPNNKVWCEVWLLNNGDLYKDQVLNKLSLFTERHNIDSNEDKLYFYERIVCMLKLDYNDMISLVHSFPYLAEFRLAKTTTAFWTELEPIEQQEWSESLVSRTIFNEDSNVMVTILDTGINNGHILLKEVLKDSNKLTHNILWGSDDHNGHGTLMAGLAVYGDLEESLSSTNNIKINHTLASVKILPPAGSNEQKLWGDITKRAVSRIEIEEPKKDNIFCMAVTSNDYKTRGKPSSWSAAIDSIVFNEKKLFIVAAGNIEPSLTQNYIDDNLTSEIHDPAQAWNILSIGAYTNKDITPEDVPPISSCLANAGELSPFSTTSLTWDKQWPNKPDIVFEGGNKFSDTHNSYDHEALSLISTYYKPTEKLFHPFNQTSAATAQAANFAANLQYEFPEAWTETIKGIMVHSAEWTDAMKSQLNTAGLTEKALSGLLLKTSGYGIPNMDKALYCLQNSLTLIAQESIQPYKKDGSVKMNEMDFYELPWPKDALLSLGGENVRLKITLSYFIDPGPGEIGYKSTNRYRYASHGLRFDINEPLEDKESFITRKNIHYQDDSYKSGEFSSSEKWLIGSDNRNRGTTISDVWRGTASELASCNFIAVYPVGGWWKERKNLKKYHEITRYSLIISIYTDDQDVDIYTEVENIVNVPVAVEI